MTRKLKTLTSILLSAILLFGLATVAFAADLDTNDPGIIKEEPYAIISSVSSSLTISGVTAKCVSSIRASGASKVSIKMELQKKSGGSFSTVKTWTATVNGSSASLSESKTINPLSTYRLKTTFTATKNSNTESTIQYRSA